MSEMDSVMRKSVPADMSAGCQGYHASSEGRARKMMYPATMAAEATPPKAIALRADAHEDNHVGCAGDGEGVEAGTEAVGSKGAGMVPGTLGQAKRERGDKERDKKKRREVKRKKERKRRREGHGIARGTEMEREERKRERGRESCGMTYVCVLVSPEGR